MIQFTLIHNFKKKLRKDGTAIINLKAYLNGKRKYISTPIYVKPTQWSKRLSKVVDHPNANAYNAEIHRQLNKLENYPYDWVRKHGSVTLNQRKPEDIILKHKKDLLYHRGLVFHKYSNQYFNRTLKEVAARAGIQKKVTSHVARHTFATHLASKVPLHILKSILQHSKIETTMIYLHLSNKLVNDALDSVDW